MEKEIKTISAKEFRKGDKYPEKDIYIFPFKVLDEKYGRIEWHIEPVFGNKKNGRYYIEKLLIWATQTQDEKYIGKLFEIECFSEMLCGDSINREGFLNYVWKVSQCEIHKNCILTAYPANHHNKLEINVGSSISIDANFKI